MHTTACAAGRSAAQHTFIRQHSAPSTPVIMAVTMAPDGVCKGDQGPEMQQLQLMSRQDYARWHSYELHIMGDGVPGVPKDKASPNCMHTPTSAHLIM